MKTHHYIKFFTFTVAIIIFQVGNLIAQSGEIPNDQVATLEKNSDECFKIYTRLNQHIELNKADSIIKYALYPFKVCNIKNHDDRDFIMETLDNLIRFDFYELDISVIDSIAHQIIDPNFKLEFFTEISGAYLVVNEEKNSEKYWSKAQEALPNATDHNPRIQYYNSYGFRNFSKGNIFSAFQIFKIAATFDKADMKHQIITMNELGNMYTSIGENEKAIEIFEKVISAAIASNELHLVRFGYFGLLDAYHNKQDYDKLIETAYKSIEHQTKIGNNGLLGYTYCNLGDGYMALSKLDSAKHCYLKGIEISIANNEYKELKDNYKSLGKYYKKIGDNETARSYFDKAININTYFPYPEIHREISDLWKLEGNYKNAYHSLHKYAEVNSIQDTANLSDVQLATQIIEDAYAYRLKTDAKIIETQREQERLLIIIIAGVITLLFISSFLYLLYRNRKKLQKLNHKILLRNKKLDIALGKQKETIKYLENFASVAAHDLKAPIRTASSFAGLLAKSTSEKLSDKEQSFLNYIDTSVSKLSQMIDDLLSLSKLDVDLPPEEKIDLSEIVDKVKDQLHNLIKEKDTEIISMSNLPIVMGHSTLLIQLFQNIIKNSITHNKTGKKTIIKINHRIMDDNSVAIQITDNSGGIPEFILPSLFDLFESTDKNNGNGIGLATCKKIVNHYGGEIWVDVEDSIGSTFHFTLGEISVI